jgi:hypothetical protein
MAAIGKFDAGRARAIPFRFLIPIRVLLLHVGLRYGGLILAM